MVFFHFMKKFSMSELQRHLSRLFRKRFARKVDFSRNITREKKRQVIKQSLNKLQKRDSRESNKHDVTFNLKRSEKRGLDQRKGFNIYVKGIKVFLRQIIETKYNYLNIQAYVALGNCQFSRINFSIPRIYRDTALVYLNITGKITSINLNNRIKKKIQNYSLIYFFFNVGHYIYKGLFDYIMIFEIYKYVAFLISI